MMQKFYGLLFFVFLASISLANNAVATNWDIGNFNSRLINADMSFYLDNSFWNYNKPIKNKYRVLGVFSSDSFDCRIWIFSKKSDSLSMSKSDASVIYPGNRRIISQFASHGRFVSVTIYNSDDGCASIARKAFR